MPYHRRDSLRAHLQRSGPLEWLQAVTFGVKLAGALESAHRLGILHRDVKPGNVLITEYGEPQLTDFGIARVTGAFETSSGEIFGSPAYTAPEVIGGDPPNVASDVYVLGATLFSLLTGHAAVQQRSDQDVIVAMSSIRGAKCWLGNAVEPVRSRDGYPDRHGARTSDSLLDLTPMRYL